MYLLDTNVVSELRKAKSGKADRNVVAWAMAVPPGDLFVSAITVLEKGEPCHALRQVKGVNSSVRIPSLIACSARSAIPKSPMSLTRMKS